MTKEEYVKIIQDWLFSYSQNRITQSQFTQRMLSLMEEFLKREGYSGEEN